MPRDSGSQDGGARQDEYSLDCDIHRALPVCTQSEREGREQLSIKPVEIPGFAVNGGCRIENHRIAAGQILGSAVKKTGLRSCSRGFFATPQAA